MQPTIKMSQLPPNAAPALTDSVPSYDISANQDTLVLLSSLLTLFYNNMPTTVPGAEFDYVSGNSGVWTADSAGVNRNASMSQLTCRINGRYITVTAVTSRSFTASKDTYIDCLDNGDGTGTLVYTEVANNAASPALASNSIRIGIIITGATTIAASTSINQGQESRILPIASSIPYSVSDSIGNMICCRDPSRRTLCFRQITTSFTLSSSQTTPTQVTGLSCPVIVPGGRKVEVDIFGEYIFNGTITNQSLYSIWDGVVNSGTKLEEFAYVSNASGGLVTPSASITSTPSSTSKTYNAGIASSGATNVTLAAAATTPAWIRVRLG